MLSEDFDKKIKTAADHHYPAYDEKAWKKMGKLLNRHMPEEKKDKRRFLFFLLLFLLIGGGYFLIPGPYRSAGKDALATNGKKVPAAVEQDLPKAGGNRTDGRQTGVVSSENPAPALPGETNDSGTENESGQPANKSMAVTTTPSPVGVVAATSSERPTGNNSTAVKIKEQQLPEKVIASSQKKAIKPANNSSKRQPVAPAATPLFSRTDQPRAQKQSNASAGINKSKADEEPATTLAKNRKPDPNKSVVTPRGNDPQESRLSDNSNDTASREPLLYPGSVVTQEKESLTDSSNLSTAPENSKDSLLAEATESEQPREENNKHPFLSKFSVLFSAGVDVSSVHSQPGQARMVKGVGIGYSLNKHIQFRTGFYAARKIYSARAEDYHAPGINYYYPNLKQVNGDCMVYEIPLLVDYIFAAKNKHSWFVSGGMSSLLMKKETYHYYYKPNGSPDYRWSTWSVENKNNHLFSMVDLSAGYNLKLGKSLMMRAEPYLRIPVTGVGAGSMKLSSGGVLFTFGMNPFK